MGLRQNFDDLRHKAAPIKTGNLKRDIMVFEVTASEVKVRQYPKSKIRQMCPRRYESARDKTKKEKGFILGRATR